MELGKPSKRELLIELKSATESLRRLARLIALMPDPRGRRPAMAPRARRQQEGLLRTLGIGDLRAKSADAEQKRACASEQAAVPSHEMAAACEAGHARAEIARIFADRLHPYFHRHDPEHHQAVERMRGLFSAAYGND